MIQQGRWTQSQWMLSTNDRYVPVMIIHGFKGKGSALHQNVGCTHLSLLRSIWAEAPVLPEGSPYGEVLDEDLKHLKRGDLGSRPGEVIQNRKSPTHATPVKSEVQALRGEILVRVTGAWKSINSPVTHRRTVPKQVGVFLIQFKI